MAGHTPKPWRFNPNPSQDRAQFIIEGPDGEGVAAVMAWIGEHREEAKANAHLVAAAPVLLTVVVALLDYHRAVRERAGSVEARQEQWNAVIDEAMVAVSKATGNA